MPYVKDPPELMVVQQLKAAGPAALRIRGDDYVDDPEGYYDTEVLEDFAQIQPVKGGNNEIYEVQADWHEKFLRSLEHTTEDAKYSGINVASFNGTIPLFILIFVILVLLLFCIFGCDKMSEGLRTFFQRAKKRLQYICSCDPIPNQDSAPAVVNNKAVVPKRVKAKKHKSSRHKDIKIIIPSGDDECVYTELDIYGSSSDIQDCSATNSSVDDEEEEHVPQDKHTLEPRQDGRKQMNKDRYKAKKKKRQKLKSDSEESLSPDTKQEIASRYIDEMSAVMANTLRNNIKIHQEADNLKIKKESRRNTPRPDAILDANQKSKLYEDMIYNWKSRNASVNNIINRNSI